MEDRTEFVNKYLSDLLNHTGRFERCSLKDGAWLNSVKNELEGATFYPFVDDEEYVRVTCENGYHYFVNVTGDSLMSIAESTLHEMMRHI